MRAYRSHEYATFTVALKTLTHAMKWDSSVVHTERWQGVNIQSDPAARTHELLHVSFNVDLGHYAESLPLLRNAIEPNLPWADDHFQERVCGVPINPGTEWANWPHGKSAERFLNSSGLFNHNYMERYWPKQAHMNGTPTRTPQEWLNVAREFGFDRLDGVPEQAGIRNDYGDLRDLVIMLANEPFTRQAYLPIFFPEDTGKGDGGRKPCTLGYHFMMRNHRLDVYYPMRSCDFANHFRDDIYLTCRLLLWVLEQCRMLNPTVWNNVTPGWYHMYVASLHCFANDHRSL